MPNLILGPILRYVGPTEATVWVETDGPCVVAALGARSRSFEVAGHHYALVEAVGLPTGAELEYEVTLDGVVVWPHADEPKGCVRTPRREDELR
ncbi:MAG TPA: alkaline phosphatase family protein, partial [Conexibacter sp.]|nr:alkaline phosphatase family protein [Conexibacter sp.]